MADGTEVKGSDINLKFKKSKRIAPVIGNRRRGNKTSI